MARVSFENSTQKPLAAGATYTGGWDTHLDEQVLYNVVSDVAGTIFIDFGVPEPLGDGTEVDWTFRVTHTSEQAIGAADPVFKAFVKGSGRAFRIRYVNGPAPQTYFNLLASTGSSLFPYAATDAGEAIVSLPLDLMTDGGDGPNRRLRVDSGQTGFFAGREFRTYYEFTGDTVFKVVVPVNVILWSLSINLLAGECRLETVVGGTEGGSFSTILPVFGRNNMSERPEPFYTPVVTIAAGGTHTGGTVLDVLRNKTSDNSNFAGAVGVNSGDERGVAANTYYFRLTVTGTTSGTLKVHWEERP